jgi:hypothetical protein
LLNEYNKNYATSVASSRHKPQKHWNLPLRLYDEFKSTRNGTETQNSSQT